jgi:hypothetical protein
LLEEIRESLTEDLLFVVDLKVHFSTPLHISVVAPVINTFEPVNEVLLRNFLNYVVTNVTIPQFVRIHQAELVLLEHLRYFFLDESRILAGACAPLISISGS